jgi:hypothetical protein
MNSCQAKKLFKVVMNNYILLAIIVSIASVGIISIIEDIIVSANIICLAALVIVSVTMGSA